MTTKVFQPRRMLPQWPQILADKEYLTVKETAIYLGISKHSLYKLTQRRVFPIYKPNNKLIYIRREDIDDWISQSRRKSSKEVLKKSNDFINK